MIVTLVSVVVEAWYSSTIILGSNGVRSDSPLPSNGVRPDITIALINGQTENTMNQETCVYRQLMMIVYMCLLWESKLETGLVMMVVAYIMGFKVIVAIELQQVVHSKLHR